MGGSSRVGDTSEGPAQLPARGGTFYFGARYGAWDTGARSTWARPRPAPPLPLTSSRVPVLYRAGLPAAEPPPRPAVPAASIATGGDRAGRGARGRGKRRWSPWQRRRRTSCTSRQHPEVAPGSAGQGAPGGKHVRQRG